MYEILPGAFIWTVFIGSIFFSFFFPLVSAICIIIFDVYWLFRVLYFILNLLISWREYRKVSRVPWHARMKRIPGESRYTHVVVLPTYKEDRALVLHTLSKLAENSYPAEKMVVIVSGEEKDYAHFMEIAKEAVDLFQSVFRDLIITVHPQSLTGELAGKGSNLHYAGALIKKYADTHGLKYKDVIVSAFDIDTVPHPDYFCYLTYRYATHPHPTATSFQPVPLYHNNIWNTHIVARIMSFGTTFWLLSELTRPSRLWTFSSHSMSLTALIDCGYWQKHLVSEDSRIFLQMFMRYDGNYSVTPLYLPVFMDAVSGVGWWETMRKIYRQQRRWAWGAEHFPFMLWHFRRNARIPVHKKLRLLWNYAEGMFSWAAVPMLILILGRLPLFFGAERFASSVLFQNTPFILEHLMRFAMIGLIVSAGLSFTLLPVWPKNVPRYYVVFLLMHWLLLPLTLILVSAIPAIDAQTRLMLGKYLGFNVTTKQRAS